MITRSADLIKDGIPVKLLQSVIAEHQAMIPRLTLLDEYYRGKHDILNRQPTGEHSPNNKVVNNFPKYISDTAIGYMFGSPIQFKAPEDKDIGQLTALFKAADVDTHDAELGKDLSVFGEGLEFIYLSTDAQPIPKLTVIDPRNGFVVYDDTVEGKRLFGVLYREVLDIDGKIDHYEISAIDENYTYIHAVKSLSEIPKLTKTEPNILKGYVQPIQYWNNEEGMGDFEGVMSLVDAYNVLQSDRINDKERFVNAILVLSGGTLDTDEEGNVKGEALRMLKNGILELGEGAVAKYLTKVLNEGEVQILRDCIVEDIHKFAQIPDFSDKQFAGNASGVAMGYKLLSLENLAKVKEQYFRAGLKERLKLFAKYLNIKTVTTMDVSTIDIIFNRKLPVNDLEVAQIIQMLSGRVSNETLLTLLPQLVKDVPEEILKLASEQEAKAKAEAARYGAFGNVDEQNV